jgi:hypothetical protein
VINFIHNILDQTECFDLLNSKFTSNNFLPFLKWLILIKFQNISFHLSKKNTMKQNIIFYKLIKLLTKNIILLNFTKKVEFWLQQRYNLFCQFFRTILRLKKLILKVHFVQIILDLTQIYMKITLIFSTYFLMKWTMASKILIALEKLSFHDYRKLYL